MNPPTSSHAEPISADAWFLTGATGVGKTALAAALAERLSAEIVSMDSMALYRGMDLGTAKPTEREQRDVPHHLIDVLAPHEEYHLAQYLSAAHDVVRQIQDRGRAVLFVGGTPLYLKGLLRGVFEGPSADVELRKRLEEEARRLGATALHQRLAEVDPESADRLHPNNLRRVVRALEVFEKTGQPVSRLRKQFDRVRPAEACRVFVLTRPREELYRRIDQRVAWMFDAGFVDEVRRLIEEPKPLSKTAGQAIGYHEVIEHLRGEHDLAETIERVQRRTRRFAKRQATWFRSLAECRFLPLTDPTDPEQLAEQIAST